MSNPSSTNNAFAATANIAGVDTASLAQFAAMDESETPSAGGLSGAGGEFVADDCCVDLSFPGGGSGCHCHVCPDILWDGGVLVSAPRERESGE